MNKILLFIFLLPTVLFSQISWQNNLGAVRSYSSPRATDLNQDGILDIVLGTGVVGFPSPYGAVAFDGQNGNILWNMESTNEIFSSPIFLNHNADGVEDVIIAGRDSELRLIDGATGELIWKFWNAENVHPNDSGWFNFYNPQLIEDVNGDGIQDLLCANGGDHSLDAFETDRPPGHLVIINGLNGEVLKKAVVPDSNETYMSPILVDLNEDGNNQLLFGTGGETIDGNLWIVDFSALINEDLSTAIPLLNNSNLGVIAPPSIADLNNDNYLDIVCQNFGGKVFAIDGNSLESLWEFHIPNTESSASPILGNFTASDNNTDVFATIYSGGQSSYNDFYQVLLDGENGNILFMDSIGNFNFSTPIAFDSNDDGNDEVLISVSNIAEGFEHELILIDFVNNTFDTLYNAPGGDVWSSPLVIDLDDDGDLELISVTQNNNPFVSDGINIQKIETTYLYPRKGLSWSSYLGNNYDGHFSSFFKECNNSNSLYLYPSSSCPGQNSGYINLLSTNTSIVYSHSWSNGAVSQNIENLSPNTYSVIVTDTLGCQNYAMTDVDEYTTSSFAEDATSYGGNDGLAYFNISGCGCNSSNCQYSWFINDSLIVQGNGSTSAETYKYLYDLYAGTYTATIVMPNGCTVSEEIIVGQPETFGCTDSEATNYNSDATTNDGSCLYSQDPCDIVPTGLIVDNIIHNRVTFNWSATDAAPSHYMIRYRVVGTTDWTVISAGPINTTAFNGTSRTRYFMEPGTTYEWSIRARVLNEDLTINCQSDWSSNSEYTTLPACANLDNLSVSAEATWVTFFADAPSEEWGVWQSKGKMRELGANSYRYVNGDSDGNINGLKGNFTASTDYEWHTKAWCTGNVDADGNSDPQYHSGWGDFSAFSTEAACDKMPMNLTTSSNGANTAVIMSWDTPESGAPDHYFLEMTNVTTGAVYEWNDIPGTATSQAKFNQNPGDEISWRIRGACGTNGTSWATIFSQPVTYTLGGERVAADLVSGLDVYPNPSRDIFNISFSTKTSQKVNVKVVNLLGEEVYTEELVDFEGYHQTFIDMNGKPKGVYFLEITTLNESVNKKIVLQ